MRLSPSIFKGPVITLGISQWFSGEKSACNAGDVGWKDPLQEEMATSSSISCQDNHIDRGALRATAHGSQRVRHDCATEYTCM